MHIAADTHTHTSTQVDFLEVSVVTVTGRIYQKTGSDFTGGCGGRPHCNQITVILG